MKTIFIPLTSGFVSRNVLQTDIFGVLKNAKIRMVFLVPQGTKKDFSKFFDSKTIFEEYPAPNFLEKKLSNFRHLNSYSQATTFKLNTETIRIKRAKLRKERPLYFYFHRLLSFLVSSSLFERGFKWLDWLVFPKNRIKKLFKYYQPTLLFSTDILYFDELYFLEHAKKTNVPIVAFILSWDNLTGRGVLPVLPDKMIVWNDIMKKEAMVLYNYKDKDIFVGGIPQFDIYFLNNEIPDRLEFFKSIGADSNKRLIAYATTPPSICDSENKIIEMILDAIDKRLIKTDCQLLVRLHPKDNPKLYDHLAERKNIIFDKPGKQSDIFRDSWNPDKNDMLHLAATLKYSDVVISIGSTVSIEAAIFDTPVINIAFDKSYAMYYDFTHFSSVVKSGGTMIAKNFDDFVKYVNEYFVNPEKDKNKRAAIVKEQCKYTDGKSGERIAHFLNEYLNIK